MSIGQQPTTQLSPNGAGLLVIGLLSILFGPFTAIPGLFMSKRFRPFSGTAAVGYFLCWFGLIMPVICLVTVLLFSAD